MTRRPRTSVVTPAVATAVLALLLAACTGGDDGRAEALQRELEQRQAALEAAAVVPDLETCPAPGGAAPAAGGDRLPALVLPCLVEGPAVALTGLAGEPTVVNLWASWCAPCRREMPLLSALADDESAGVRVLGVDTKDTRAAAAGYLAELGATYPHVVDDDGALLGALNVVGLPVTVALDEEGRVVDREVGEADAADLDRLAAAARGDA